MGLRFERMSSAFFALTLLLGIFVISLPARAAINGEGVELSDDAIALGEELTITYRTENKSDTNWIGIYDAGQDPRDGGASNGQVRGGGVWNLLVILRFVRRRWSPARFRSPPWGRCRGPVGGQLFVLWPG